MKLPPVLAIDLGTSSVRAGLFDIRGKRIPGALAQRIYTLKTARDGKAELDPFDVLRQTKACIKEATAGWHAIAAVGMSCFWHSLLGTDAQGNPLTPIYTWADSRCSEDAARMRGELSEREVHAETGCMMRSSFWPAKLRWLQRTDRSRFQRVRYWMSPGEWVQWRLAGASRCAIGMATATGLFDPSALEWSPMLLGACNFSAERMLPVSDDPVDWRGVPWYPAIGDGAASNLGSGATGAGRGAINIGTSAALRVMREGRTAEAPFGLFAYRVDAHRYLVGGAVSNAGNLHAWCLRELRLNDDAAAIERSLSERPAPEHGLTVLPFWSAERAPTWDENARGAIIGLRQSTSALDLLQAVTEGFYHRLGMIAEMVACGEQPRWIVSGGILKSKSALRRLANVMGRSIYANPEPEASLRGAAVFAIEKLGHPITEMRYGQAVAPTPSLHRLYRADRARQAEVEARLAGSEI